MNAQLFEEITRGVQSLLPKDAQRLKDDFEQNLRAMVAAALERMDLVTRDELDRQTQLLELYREKLTALEQRVAELEQAESTDPPGADPTPS